MHLGSASRLRCVKSYVICFFSQHIVYILPVMQSGFTSQMMKLIPPEWAPDPSVLLIISYVSNHIIFSLMRCVVCRAVIVSKLAARAPVLYWRGWVFCDSFWFATSEPSSMKEIYQLRSSSRRSFCLRIFSFAGWLCRTFDHWPQSSLVTLYTVRQGTDISSNMDLT